MPPSPSHPNGWFQVAWSHELGPRAVLPLRCLDRDLVLFRKEDGGVAILDAHCPHLGAHLGVGGCVEGDTIRCPFHHWRYDGDGHCVSIPYGKKTDPRKIRARAWPVREWHGAILLHVDAAGAPPTYEPPDVEEAGWRVCARRQRRIRAHIRQIGENGVDFAHLAALHENKYRGRPIVERFEVDGPVLRFATTSETRVLGRFHELRLDFQYVGPGIAVARVSRPIEFRIVFGMTPIGAGESDLRTTISIRPTGNPIADLAARHLLPRGVWEEIGRDIPIWEHQAVQARPQLCDGDGPILAFRRWYEQFYAAGAQVQARTA
jgi:phenylpropionate dioxygenase-like ring-hydroxylating dioxygenase large terminal subunit